MHWLWLFRSSQHLWSLGSFTKMSKR